MTIVNWFSPMPPAKTEIAHHSARILAALRQRLEVSVWTAQGRLEQEVERLAPIHEYDPQWPPWRELNRADLNIYNIGNNCDFHGAIWQVSRQAPGVVILHDGCVQHFFAGFFLNRMRDLAAYEREMSRIYGPAACAMVADYLAGRCSTDEVASSFPLTQLAIENCLGVVVHSPILFDAVKELTSAPVLYAPLPYPAASTLETLKEERWKTLADRIQQQPQPAEQSGSDQPAALPACCFRLYRRPKPETRSDYRSSRRASGAAPIPAGRLWPGVGSGPCLEICGTIRLGIERAASRIC